MIGGETNMKDEEKKIEEHIIKGDGQPAPEVKPEAPKVEEKPEAPKVEEKPEVQPVVEKKAAPEPKDGDECMMADGKTKGHMKDGKCMEDGKKVEKKEEVKAPEIIVKVDITELKDEFKKLADSFRDVLDKVTKVEEKISKQAPAVVAPAEKKDAPVEVAKTEVTPKEEVKVEKKADTSSEGASEAILKSLEDIKKSFEERIEKLEKQPAPSKVVFSKEFGGSKDEGEMTVEKINARLDELKKVMTDDPARYMKDNMADEAIALVKQKKALAKK